MNVLQRMESLARPAIFKTCAVKHVTPISALVSIQQQQVRFVRHPRITKPRFSHTLRAHVEYLAKPKYFDVLKALPPNETCELNAKYSEERESSEQVVTLYETVLAREALKKFQESPLTLIFHRNLMDSSDWFDARIALHKQGFKTDVLGRKILEIALRGTKFETVLPLFCTHSIVGFGKFETTPLGVEPKRVKALIKALRKTPGIVLMAGVMGDSRMMSASQLKEFGDWGDKRVELASTLRQASGVNLSRTLSHHFGELSRILSQVGKQS